MSEPVRYMELTRRRYEALGYEPYRWAASDTPPPFRRLAKPLKGCRVALISSAGVYMAGQVAYHYKDDSSLREIPADVAVDKVRFSHVTEHLLGDARKDPGALFPIAAMREAAADGLIGGVSDPLFSCMGGIYSQRRVREDLQLALLAALAGRQIDAAVLVALCPVCHQTMATLARAIEGSGIPTVMLASAFDIVESVNPPRALFLDYPLGHTAGRPNDKAEQKAILRRALGLLETMQAPGIVRLDYRWAATDDWKKKLLEETAEDKRAPRDLTPRYQTDEDRRLAEGV